MHVALPRVRLWSIVVFEYDGGPKPLFALTTPVEDAAVVLRQKADEQAKKIAEQKAKAGIGPGLAPAETKLPFYKDYAHQANADLDEEKKMPKPAGLAITRNGVLDLHHARGAFSWLNPMESVAALLDGGTCRPSWVDFVGFKEGPAGCMDEFPNSYEALMGYDVLVLDDVHARHLGAKNRVMIAEFVRQGGGLLVIGGYFNLSLGGDHNSYIEEVMPVTIAGYKQIVRDDKGLARKAEKPAFFDKVDWSGPLQAFTVDVSPLKPGAEVLATAGGKPAIVSGTYGKGRVVVVMMNPHGDYPPTAKPYWLSSQWPRILAACVRWLGEDARQTIARAGKARQIDPSKIKPDDLMMGAMDLSSREFTAKLKEARANMIDAASARALLETAVENVDKIEDVDLLAGIVEDAKVYFDKSMATLGEKLVGANLDFVRQGGYQILGMAGDAKYRGVLEKGLLEKNSDVVREALIGLGRMGDPASLTPVRNYLALGGSEKLLGLTVLVRLHDQGALKNALPAYAEGLARQVRLKCGRGALIDSLWGGVSFKLTAAERKRLMNEYQHHLRTEEQARFDVQYFAESLKAPTDEELKAIAEFLAGCERREVLAMAYAVLNRLPPAQAKPYRAMLAKAKLAELRMLAEE